MATTSQQRIPRTRRFSGCRSLTATLLGLGWVTYAPSAPCESASDLSEVIEEAKRPAEEQYVVLRESTPDGDDGFLTFLFSGLFSFSSESEPEPEPEPEFGPRPPAASLFDGLQVALTSVYLRPEAGVLKSLRGGGIAFRGSRSAVEMEIAAHVMQGEIRPESYSYGGLAAPFELAGSLQARVNLSRNTLGVSGFLGIQYGHLFWRYQNSVLAVDVDGNGEEVWRDSIGNVSGFVGIGITPIQTPSFLLGVNVRVGLRTYLADTVEGFRNDVFKDDWYSQVGVELAFRL